MGKLLVAAVAALIAGLAAYYLASGTKSDSSVSLSTETSASAAAEAPRTLESTSTAASVSTAVATATQAPALPVRSDSDAFRERASAVQAQLPTREKIKALTAEEVHGTPKLVIDAGARIGELADAIEKNSGLAPEGIAFYGRCARRDDLVTSVRALCLSDLRDLAKKQGTTPDESGIPASVTRLADKLKESR